jgi:hypothetical protein
MYAFEVSGARNRETAKNWSHFFVRRKQKANQGESDETAEEMRLGD